MANGDNGGGLWQWRQWIMSGANFGMIAVATVSLYQIQVGEHDRIQSRHDRDMARLTTEVAASEKDLTAQIHLVEERIKAVEATSGRLAIISEVRAGQLQDIRTDLVLLRDDLKKAIQRLDECKPQRK